MGGGLVRNIGGDRGHAESGADGIERLRAAGDDRHPGAVRRERLDQSQAEATASAGDDSTLSLRLICLLLCLGAARTIEVEKRSQSMWPGTAGGNEPYVGRLAEGASGVLRASAAEGQI